MLFVGDDWAEDHHDIEIVDDTGRLPVRRPCPRASRVSPPSFRRYRCVHWEHPLARAPIRAAASPRAG